MSILSLFQRAANVASTAAGISALVGASAIQEAARKGDQVEHSGALAGVLVGAAAGVLVGAALVMTGGLAAPLLIGLATGISLGSTLGEIAGRLFKKKAGQIETPCADRVYINKSRAARSAGEGAGGGDYVEPCLGAPFGRSHPHQMIAEGSGMVFIEGQPAARKGDRLMCGATIAEGSPNVFIGGGTRQYAEIDDEIPWYLTIGLILLGFVGTGLYRALWQVLKNPKLLLRLPRGFNPQKIKCSSTGDPVEIASGRVFTSQTDFELPGRVAIEFTRSYDTSAVDYEGMLGHGWIHPYEIHLWEDDEQQMVILRNEEALLAGFGPIAVGEKILNPLSRQWLERLAEQVYAVGGQDGLRYRFESVASSDSGNEAGRIGKSEATALRLTAIEDRNGNRIDLSYVDGRLDSLRDGAGTRLNFSYLTLDHGAERLASVNLALDRDSGRTARLVHFTYDAEGRLVNATDRGLVPHRYAYADRLLIRETNRNGLSFHFDYAGRGSQARCVHTWGDGGIYERWLEYHPEAMMTVVEDSLGRKTTCYFNSLKLAVKIVDPLGGSKHYTYGLNGELLSETDELGRRTTFKYNARFDCVRIGYPDGTARSFEYNDDSLPQKLVDESGAEFERVYDQRGNLAAAIDALGNRCQYGYNQFGELERAIDPLGGETKFKWNERGQLVELSTPLGAVTRYGYDDRGRLVRVSDPLGRATRYAYDALDRLILVERPDGAKHRHEYDPEGNLTRFEDANGAETRFRYVDYNGLGERIDALGYRRRFVYDTEANLIEIRNERDEVHRFGFDGLDRLAREVGFDGLTWEYEYDPAGQLVVRTDPAGRVTRFIRDQNGQVIERRRSDGTAVNFSYDLVGRLTEAVAPGSELSFEYDVLGRVIRESQNGQVLEHEYDALGRRTRRRSPAGRAVDFVYDADDRLSCLKTPRGSMWFEYDKAGQLTKRRLPGALEESFHYDRCGRLIEQSLYRSSHTLVHRGYQYDAEGNLIELNDSHRGPRRFVYDPVERLHEVSQPEKKVERFFYDSTGNLLRRGERRFHYGRPDRLTGADDAVLIYDELGNLIEKRRGRTAIRYSYDSDNQLIAIESKEGGRVEFAYDAFGRRIAKQTNEGETGFWWDGDVLLSERRDERETEYVFALDDFQPRCRFDEAVFESYHNDQLGTPREVTDQAGRVVWSASYDVYGRLDEFRGAESANQIRFQGQYEDPETGLYYNRFRYYDPDCQRYISRDPIGILGGRNHYHYVECPINEIDPLGLVKCKKFGNLYPQDKPSQVQKFKLENRGGRWVTVSSTGTVRTASGRYIFVRQGDNLYAAKPGTTVGGRFAAERPVGHIDLADGKKVDYAGRIQFSGRTNRGSIRWWDNGSGHYQPTKEHAGQAGLPMDSFVPFVPGP
ncbi:MAG TPA: RHS repeat-associated core domain-containing protein [Blastocatellia bacterium]|nr:RHS repeat-associated core domain-containing protein [Blastocatellia bacterium]